MKSIAIEKIFDGVFIACLGYVILSTSSMFFYPGGTFRDVNTIGYIPTLNFLSDLGRTVAFNGEPNPFGAVIYIVGLSSVGIMTIWMFLRLPRIFNEDRWTRLFYLGSRILGVISGIGFIGIAFTPNNLWDVPHTIFVNIAFMKLLQALFLLMLCIYRTPHFPNRFGHLLFLANSVLFGFILLKILGPSIHTSDDGLKVQATAQKVMVYTMIISLSILALGTKKVWQEFNSRLHQSLGSSTAQLPE